MNLFENIFFTGNRNECDGMSDDSVSSPPSAGDNLNNSLTGLGNSSSLYLQHNSLLHLTPRHRGSGQKHSSTPFRSNIHKIDNSDLGPEHPRRTVSSNYVIFLIKNMLTRRKESDTYLATVSRHRWSRQIPMKIDK